MLRDHIHDKLKRINIGNVWRTARHSENERSHFGSLEGACGRASCRVGKAGKGSRLSSVSALGSDLERLMLFREDTFEIPRKFITKEA